MIYKRPIVLFLIASVLLLLFLSSSDSLGLLLIASTVFFILAYHDLRHKIKASKNKASFFTSPIIGAYAEIFSGLFLLLIVLFKIEPILSIIIMPFVVFTLGGEISASSLHVLISILAIIVIFFGIIDIWHLRPRKDSETLT